jgi:4'-phosphopantetheinyl transferase
MLLAARLGGDPQALDLRFGSLGKPEVPNANVWFNVSHTPGLAVIAISRASPVGIDVERIDPSVDVVGVARLAFGKARGSELSHLRGPDRITNFFKAWVEEEARVKMVGGSIATTISGEAMTDLEVVALEPPRVGFAAALAGRGPLEVVVERDRS